MSNSDWKRHASGLVLAAVAVASVAWFSGHALWVVLAAVTGYALWQLVNQLKLQRWLDNPEGKAPRSLGPWAGIYHRIAALADPKNRDNKPYTMLIEDFQNLMDSFPDAFLVVDDNCHINWFNRTAGELLALRQPMDIGRPATTLLRNTSFADWLVEGDGADDRLEIRAPGWNNVWLEASSVPIRESQRLIILRDVSEVHNVERIRRDFVTNVSHELRTPLTVMLGYLEIFQDRPSDDMTDALQRMHAQAVQMQSMLDDFLELSRLQAVESDDEETTVNVHEMLLQLSEQAKEISRGDHTLKFNIDENLKLVGIPSDLESAFRNLLVNAVKYTPEGGTVCVCWRDSEKGPKLVVSDTGIGIPQREIPKLTERFYRVGSDRGRKSGGTGLGLAIVKHVLNAHQARLVIKSEVGVGSEFICAFPSERKR